MVRLAHIRRHCRDYHRQGIAALEFALSLIFLWAPLILGFGDAAQYLLVNEKIDRIAYSVCDIVTQYQTITIASLNDIMQGVSQIMSPITFGNKGLVIVTSVYKPSGQTPIIEWQYAGGGTLTSTSRIGTTGGAPTLPNGLTLNDNDNVIITEVYYQYSPLFTSNTTFASFASSTLYQVSMYKPRLSPLITPPT